MKRISVTALVLSLALAGTASAQFGKLKKELGKALGQTAEEQAGEPGAAGPGAAGSRARPGPKTDAGRKYAPGLSYSTVLNGIDLLANGKLSVDRLQATFLPAGTSRVVSVLRTADGQELYEMHFNVETLQNPYSLLSRFEVTDLATGARLPAHVDFGRPGDYVLDFYLPDEQFFTLPFSVVKLGSSDDPFGEGECYTLGGDWRDWGYLYYGDAKPDQNLAWKAWLHGEGCEEKPVKVSVEVRRDADGELVCTSRELVTHTVQPKWVRLELDMVFPEGKTVPRGTYFKAGDLLGTDGPHTLTMTIDGKPYGTWKFVVAGGKLEPAGRTLRGEADPLTFVEGGRDAFWYGRVQ